MSRLVLIVAFIGLVNESCQPASQAENQTQVYKMEPASLANTPAHGQILVVLTDSWADPSGELHKLYWDGDGWKNEGKPIPVLIGKKGLGWGIGLEDYTQLEGPIKKEGDLKSPAGVFKLGTAFGYVAQGPADFVKMPYTPITESTMCIEDTRSKHYNRIIDEGSTPSDWNSTDHMLRKDDLYEWGLLVEHNYSPAQAGSGSCIFLHVWNPNGTGTAGCTSMEKQKLRDLLGWLDPSLSPLLLQIPDSEYNIFMNKFNLPEI